MTTVTRTARLAGLLAVALISMASPTGSDGGSITVGRHTVYGADQSAIAKIEHADAVFASAGLRLPGLEIHVRPNFAACDGLGGRFNVDGSGRSVELCSGLQFTVLHEFAHAWAHHNLSDETRRDFVELHGLPSWNDPDIPWARRGTEVAAETIAKALLNSPLPDWQQEVAAELDAGYTLLTGTRSPRFAAAVRSAMNPARVVVHTNAGVGGGDRGTRQASNAATIRWRRSPIAVPEEHEARAAMTTEPSLRTRHTTPDRPSQ